MAQRTVEPTATPPTSPPTSPGAPRLVWVDVAKAIAITLVVVHHVVVFSEAAGWLPPVVPALNAQIATVRMPLFFLVSGLFAAGALRRPWAVVLRRRIVFFAYLYVLWTLLRFGLFQVVPDVRAHGADGDLDAVLMSPLLPGTGLWFVYALALYSIAAKTALRVPVPAQLAVAVVLAAVVAAIGYGQVDANNFAWRNMAMHYVFFLAGMHLRARVEAFAERTTTASTAVLAVVTAAGVGAVSAVDAGRFPGVWLLLSCVAVAFGVALSVQVARVRALAGPLAGLGQRTLPVYLMHVPWVAAGVALLDGIVAPASVPGVALAGVVALVAGALSLVTHRPLQVAVPWLFALPGRRAVVLAR